MSEHYFAEKIGLREYTIPTEAEEQIKEWKNEIQIFINELTFKKVDFVELQHLMRRENREWFQNSPLLEVISNHLEVSQEKLDEEQKTLLAIGLWILKKKGPFSWISSPAKVLFGKNQPLAEILTPESRPNCIDTAVLSKVMGEEFGVTGTLETLEGNRFQHRFLKTDSGRVLDVWWAADTGGLVESQEVYVAKNVPRYQNKSMPRYCEPK